MDAPTSSTRNGAASANAAAATATRTSQLPPPPGISPKSYALSGKIMLSAIVSLLVVVLLLLCLHIYSRWYFLRLARRRRRARAAARRAATAGSGGLDPELIKSLPVFMYSPSAEQGKETPHPECAVCLCEFEERDQAKVLPSCRHVFHAECIDMWFYSHSTCPLCRDPVDRASRSPGYPASAACRCGEEGKEAETATSSRSASASSSTSESPQSISNSSMTSCLPTRTTRPDGVSEVLHLEVDFDLERGVAVAELNPSTANRASSKMRTHNDPGVYHVNPDVPGPCS